MLKAGLLGEKMGPPTPDPEAISYMFDGLRRMADPNGAERITVQWDFADAEPWFLRVDNGDRTAAPGRLEDPDITLRCRFEDWVDLAAGREDPRRAMLTGKLRPRGRLRALWRARNMFV